MDDLLHQDYTWEMVCPGCSNACRLVVYGKTLDTLQRVQGAQCGAGITHVRRYFRNTDRLHGEGRDSNHREE